MRLRDPGIVPGGYHLFVLQNLQPTHGFCQRHLYKKIPAHKKAMETLFRAITWFPSPSCGRGFSHRDAFGKTHEWVASPEEQRDGNPLKQCPDPVAS